MTAFTIIFLTYVVVGGIWLHFWDQNRQYPPGYLLVAMPTEITLIILALVHLF